MFFKLINLVIYAIYLYLNSINSFKLNQLIASVIVLNQILNPIKIIKIIKKKIIIGRPIISWSFHIN